MGPMTGRGAGFCGGYAIPGVLNAVGRAFGFGRAASFGGGRGAGFGGGRGWRHRFYATGMPGWMWRGAGPWGATTPTTEKQMLEDQAQALEAELGQIRKRLDELGEPQEPKG
jgi:hypothetical protein